MNITEHKILIWLIGICGGLWITIGAPAILYVAFGLYQLSIEYHSNAAISAEWRQDIGQRLVRIERKQDQLVP